jgi:hypothetical protein
VRLPEDRRRELTMILHSCFMVWHFPNRLSSPVIPPIPVKMDDIVSSILTD